MRDQQKSPNKLQETVETIVAQLGETDPHPSFQIRRIVQHLGPETALSILQEVLEIEASGGMMLSDGSRRRTPGGVFFYLVRQRVSSKDRAYIFPSAYQRKKTRKKKAQPPLQPLPLTWDKRMEVVSPSLAQKGDARSVKIILIGRPGRIIQAGDCVVTTMQSRRAPSLPRELPSPPETPTTYAVYIARKQWRKVEEVIKNPEDALIVEGFPSYDPELKGMAVFARFVTTKRLQAAQRQEQAQKEAS